MRCATNESRCEPKTADRSRPSQGADLLKLPKIQAAIVRVETRRLKRLEVDVLEQYRRIAFWDVRDLFDENGDLLTIHELPDHVASRIASMDFGPDGKVKRLRFADRNQALQMLARHLDLLRPEMPTATIGSVTNINVTEVILEQLSTEELRLLEKMLLLKSAASHHPPSLENPFVDGAPQPPMREEAGR